MEEKLFWISIVSGVYAFSFKRFLREPKRLEKRMGVVLLNGLFWAFVGVAAGFLIVSYKELNTLSWPIGVACGLAGGLLGGLWVLPTQVTPSGVQLLWGVQGVAYTVALGALLRIDQFSLVLGTLGLGLLGVGAGQLARSASAPIGRASVAGCWIPRQNQCSFLLRRQDSIRGG